MSMAKESTLSILNKIKVPPYPKPMVCIGEKVFEKPTRLKCFIEMLKEIEPLSTAKEALEIIQDTIEHVEDLYSGREKEITPPNMATERMYKALNDNIKPRKDGGISVITKGNRIEIDANGSFTIYDRLTEEIWLKKDGTEK
jgi:hypothetical protein